MRSKYGAIRSSFRGRTYASKAEMRWGMYYQAELDAGRIKGIEYQPIIELVPRPNRIKYVPDFLIHHLDGSQEYVEVKGVWTAVAKLKLKLLKHFHPEINLTIVN